MNNGLDTLITLAKEYVRILENKRDNQVRLANNYHNIEVTDARVERTGLILRQTMLDFETGRMK